MGRVVHPPTWERRLQAALDGLTAAEYRRVKLRLPRVPAEDLAGALVGRSVEQIREWLVSL